ncbi:MAG TPA: FdtA/QdtA family cupin domain-containing protein [Sphingomonas sp.]
MALRYDGRHLIRMDALSLELPGHCRLHRFPVLGDARGSLIALESGREVPFAIARVYYIFGTQAGVSRGFHAHRQLTQLAVCVSGSCTMLLDSGQAQERVVLDRPDLAVEIAPMVWHEMHDFSADCVLAVLADDIYDEADYIRNYADFTALVRTGAAA